MSSFESNGAGVPKVVAGKATGAMVMLEVLRYDEVIGTKLSLPGSASGKDASEVPQGYVLDVGKAVPDTHKVVVGDRVVFSSMATPMPYKSAHGRDIVLVNYTGIHGILEEAKTEFHV